jgi:hypothetical protein
MARKLSQIVRRLGNHKKKISKLANLKLFLHKNKAFWEVLSHLKFNSNKSWLSVLKLIALRT